MYSRGRKLSSKGVNMENYPGLDGESGGDIIKKMKRQVRMTSVVYVVCSMYMYSWGRKLMSKGVNVEIPWAGRRERGRHHQKDEAAGMLYYLCVCICIAGGGS